MKTMMLLLLLFVSIPTARAAREDKEFRVSQTNTSPANKKLFMALWEALQKPRLTDNSVKMTFYITQAVKKEADGMHRYLCDYDKAVILQDGNILEDATVTVWVNPAGVYDFTTVAGSTRRVELFKEAVAKEDEEAPEKEEFVERLKAGETFTVRTINPTGCAKCFGDGKLGASEKYEVCLDCGGSGEAITTWTIKW